MVFQTKYKAARTIGFDVILFATLLACLYASMFIWKPIKRGFFCGDESLMYPYRGNTVSDAMKDVYTIVPPLIIFLICEWVIQCKSKDYKEDLRTRLLDYAYSVYCVLKSFSLGLIFTNMAASVAKKVIGRLRPYFFEICKPSVDCDNTINKGRYIYPNEYNCANPQLTSSKLVNLHVSFLSGHAIWMAYSMIFVAIYMEKRMQWSARALRHTLQFAAICFSWYVALTRVSDYMHHWSDVLAGYVLGAIAAIVMSVWCTSYSSPNNESNPTTSRQPQEVQLCEYRQATELA